LANLVNPNYNEGTRGYGELLTIPPGRYRQVPEDAVSIVVPVVIIPAAGSAKEQ
jgi:hypothetical protein